MKLLDKFLKFLQTDRNTFFTYILTLISAYIVVDRVVEFLLIVFTGVASNYWGPIAYAVAFLFPIFAFLFSFSSKFVTCDDDKLGLLYTYFVTLYVLIVTMITEWINELIWIGLLSLPGYTTIVSEFAYLIKPALSSIAIALPLSTAHLVFKTLFTSSKTYLLK